MFKSISGLAQLVHESIAEINQNMMLAFTQMLQGVGFVLGLQSPYNQGQYPLALVFKFLADAPPKALSVPIPVATPPPTLAGVPTSKQTAVRLSKTSNTNSEESAPIHAHNGGTAKLFVGSKQNDVSDAS